MSRLFQTNLSLPLLRCRRFASQSTNTTGSSLIRKRLKSRKLELQIPRKESNTTSMLRSRKSKMLIIDYNIHTIRGMPKLHQLTQAKPHQPIQVKLHPQTLVKFPLLMPLRPVLLTLSRPIRLSSSQPKLPHRTHPNLVRQLQLRSIPH